MITPNDSKLRIRFDKLHYHKQAVFLGYLKEHFGELYTMDGRVFYDHAFGNTDITFKAVEDYEQFKAWVQANKKKLE